jgi:hypothetical protein
MELRCCLAAVEAELPDDDMGAIGKAAVDLEGAAADLVGPAHRREVSAGASSGLAETRIVHDHLL